MLCGNIALNALDNVFAHNTAVGRAPGSISVPPVNYEQPGNFGGVELGRSATGEPVPLVTIDSLALERCDFMKIDVEGMELDVLVSAAETLRRFRPRLYIENDRVEKSPALIEHLFALDYRLYWHTPFLYRPDNFFGDEENIFPGIVSDNVIALPREGQLSIVDLIEITSKDARVPRSVPAAAV
jgi:FkbM family methyltransferase